jgi:hypothetical protein
MSTTIPSISLEFLATTVTAASDPTAADVYFNIQPLGVEPGVSGWVAGAWEGAAEAVGNGFQKARARVLVGPGSSFELPNGRYGVWVRVDAAPEAPVRNVGALLIT